MYAAASWHFSFPALRAVPAAHILRLAGLRGEGGPAGRGRAAARRVPSPAAARDPAAPTHSTRATQKCVGVGVGVWVWVTSRRRAGRRNPHAGPAEQGFQGRASFPEAIRTGRRPLAPGRRCRRPAGGRATPLTRRRGGADSSPHARRARHGRGRGSGRRRRLSPGPRPREGSGGGWGRNGGDGGGPDAVCQGALGGRRRLRPHPQLRDGGGRPRCRRRAGPARRHRRRDGDGAARGVCAALSARGEQGDAARRPGADARSDGGLLRGRHDADEHAHAVALLLPLDRGVPSRILPRVLQQALRLPRLAAAGHQVRGHAVSLHPAGAARPPCGGSRRPRRG